MTENQVKIHLCVYDRRNPDFQIKEELAEEYREFELSKGTKKWQGQYKKNSLFDKIKNFIFQIFLYPVETLYMYLYIIKELVCHWFGVPHSH